MKQIYDSMRGMDLQKELHRLRTPKAVQDFVNALAFNFEEDGDTCHSPRQVLEVGKAQCMEGAMLAASALRLQGQRPIVLDLVSTDDDFDHVVALFKQHGCWGAISKTNHAVLRYREPVYRTVRELTMSYFHEYFLQSNGKKTLRAWATVDLTKFDRRGWMIAEEDVWYIPEYLCVIPHQSILTPAQVRGLRKAEQIERKAGEHVEWKEQK